MLHAVSSFSWLDSIFQRIFVYSTIGGYLKPLTPYLLSEMITVVSKLVFWSSSLVSLLVHNPLCSHRDLLKVWSYCESDQVTLGLKLLNVFPLTSG